MRHNHVIMLRTHKTLYEEGGLLKALFVLCCCHLSRGADFDELGDDRSDLICDLLLAKGKVPGLSGCRSARVWGFED